ncbi:hypothetical protein [Nocardiopsis sp. NPDC055824]
MLLENRQAANRVDDFLGMFEQDRRIQVVFAVGRGSRFERSAEAYTRNLDGFVLTADQVERFEFDLAIAANNSHNSHLEKVRAPTLVIPHGVGFSKIVKAATGYGPPLVRPPVNDAVYSNLVRYGRVIPAAIGVSHENHRAILANVVPESLEVTHLVGDPCLDRALMSRPERERYRQAIGVGDGERLVLLSSSWGRRSLLGRHPGLLEQLMDDLPHDHVAAVNIHPGVWSAHGGRQVHAWLAGARRRGLRVLAENSPWLGLHVAADVVIGDHGSTTYVSSALGTPVLLASGDLTYLAPGSPLEALHRYAPVYEPTRPLMPQIEKTAESHDPRQASLFTSLLTSAPGRSAELLRALVYRLMNLSEPVGAASLPEVAVPRFVGGGAGEGVSVA